jgi:hypothetical protein
VEAAILAQDHTTNVTVEPADVNVTMPSSMAVTMSAYERDALAGRIADQVSDETLRVTTFGDDTVSIAIPDAEGEALAADIADKIAEKTLNVDAKLAGNVDGVTTATIVQGTVDAKLAGNVDGTTTAVETDVTMPSMPTATQIADAISADNVETGVYYYADGSTLYCHKILLPDGTMTGYNQAVMANGNWQGFGVRTAYQGKKVYRFGGAQWILADDSVDIGQSLTIPEGALTVNIPDIINVTGTVSVDPPDDRKGVITSRIYSAGGTRIAVKRTTGLYHVDDHMAYNDGRYDVGSEVVYGDDHRYRLLNYPLL